MNTLPKTKFTPPLQHGDLIPRPALRAWLQRELPHSRLTLLSAPAGYGKTTLLACLPEALPQYRLGWFALDGADNDLVRFLSGLAEALAAIDPSLAKSIAEPLNAAIGMIGSGSLVFPMQQVMTALINALLALPDNANILVLDDLHEITQPVIFEALDYFLDKQPAQLHLAITTRFESSLHLNRLRARRQLAELNMVDLSFNFDESQLFLNGLLNLELSEADLHALHQKTEGWPVGLVLLTSRLRHLLSAEQRADFLNHLDHVDSNTFDYLAEEVLTRQPEPVRTFLLQTSILSELTPSLCRAISGASNAAGLLAEIYRRNLFLSQVSGANKLEEPVYHYHTLFAEFLQRLLEAESPLQYRALHLRAAQSETTPARIIAHLLAAQEWQGAADQIEAVGTLFLEQGFQETVSSWIAALPGELAACRPQLLYLQGLARLLRSSLEDARQPLEQALALLQPGEAPELYTRLLSTLASLAFTRADFKHSAALIHQAEGQQEEGLKQIEFLMLRCSLALFWESDWQRATDDLQAAWSLVQSSSDNLLWYLFAIYLGTEFTVLPGALDLLERFCAAARQRYGEQITPLRLGVEDLWAGIHVRRGRLKTALEVGQNALRVKAQLGGYAFLGLNASLAVASACTGLGNYPAAEAALQRVLLLSEEAELNRALSGGGFYPLGKLRWLEGRFDEVRRLYQAMDGLPQHLPLVETQQKMLGGLLELSAKRYAQAEKLLIEAVRLQAREQISETYSSARLLLAYLYESWGKPQEALAQLDAVLARCEANQTPGLILQDTALAAPLLRLAASQGMRARQATALLGQMGLPLETPEPESTLLTGRQIEILRLLSAGYSNQAIADELVLSLATVKSHVVHIMDRLGASSRSEAVALARQKGLL